ncbi:hypothetical protein [Erythrobacter alti]|uniref:hypothetical protein n=1 Tax=Erythrobacter alti TaxID=1896145 RepID=UPI0030F49D79
MTAYRTLTPLTATPLVLALAACASTPSVPALPAPQEAFWEALSSHCGEAYEGALESEDARDADWAGKRMIAHWAECSDTRIAIAFHVEDAGQPDGWNRSRTWLVTRTSEGLRLKHDHRHEDGHEDAVTQYGGDTLSTGSRRVQDFPVDAYSIALFERDGLDLSLTNVWRLEVDPADERGGRFTYQLTRRNDPTRLFRVSFDASDPIAPPPPAWGW